MIVAEEKLLFNNASVGNRAKVLEGIHAKEKNIAIYQRDIKLWQKELKQLATTSVECKVSGTVDEITTALEANLKEQLPNYDFLLEDISNILSLFQKVSKAESFRVLLATVKTNMCRKFHTDINDLRLLCTYAGPGTLWLPDEIINQKAFKSKNQNIVLDENLIQQANIGDIVILKGALYPDAEAILHRSPTIEETGEQRLLLRIDTNSFLNFWK